MYTTMYVLIGIYIYTFMCVCMMSIYVYVYNMFILIHKGVAGVVVLLILRRY